MATSSKPPGWALITGAVCLLVLVGLSFQRWLDKGDNPAIDTITQLKKSEIQGLREECREMGLWLVSHHHQFQRLSLSGPPSASHAQISGTLDFTGKFGPTSVSSLGLETVEFERIQGEWKATTGLAPRLASIVTFLERRRRMLETADKESLEAMGQKGWDDTSREWQVWKQVAERKFIVTAWFIRSEREEVLVREEYRVTGTLPDIPVDKKGVKTLQLEPISGGWQLKGAAFDALWK